MKAHQQTSRLRISPPGADCACRAYCPTTPECHSTWREVSLIQFSIVPCSFCCPSEGLANAASVGRKILWWTKGFLFLLKCAPPPCRCTLLHRKSDIYKMTKKLFLVQKIFMCPRKGREQIDVFWSLSISPEISNIQKYHRITQN